MGYKKNGRVRLAQEPTTVAIPVWGMDGPKGKSTLTTGKRKGKKIAKGGPH